MIHEKIHNNFEVPASRIHFTHEELRSNVRHIINRHITAKAWLTGYYIVEYEQYGSDRANYGEKLLPELSKRLGKRNFSVTNLKIYRQFYLVYPVLLPEIGKFLVSNESTGQSLTGIFQLPDSHLIEKSLSQTDQYWVTKQTLISQSHQIN